MVMYRRLTGDLFVDPLHLSNPASARIAFYARSPLADEIDPIAKLSNGCFLLFPRINDWPGFIAALPQHVGQFPANVRIALLTRNGAPFPRMVRSAGIGSSVEPDHLMVGKAASGSGPAYSPPTGNERWRIVLRDAQLEADGDTLRIDFTSVNDKPGLRLDTSAGYWVPLPSGARWIKLPIAGPDRGLWQIPAALDRKLLNDLAVGPSYFEAQSATKFKRLAYPLFDFAGGQTERFDFRLDLSDPYDTDASRNPSRLDLPDTELPSQLFSVHGHRIFLKAAAQGDYSGLRLLQAPEEIQTVGGKLQLRFLEHHLAPTGAFELHVEDSTVKEIRLGLGASNLESIAVSPGAAGNLLDFAPGPALVSDEQLLRVKEFAALADNPLLLSDLGGFFRTSWLNIASAFTSVGASRLSLDPEGMQGYAPGADAMRFSPTRPPVALGSIPWVPVLGVAARPNAGTDELRVERQYLSRARRRLILPRAKATFSSTLRPAIADPELRTPQGYAAARTAEGWLAKVVFGRTDPRDPQRRTTTDLPDFGLVPKNDEGHAILAEMMASNRLCIVTKLSKLIQFFEPHSLGRIYMADWKAGWLNDDGTNNREPYLILKHDNRSLQELVHNSTQWTNQDGPLALDAAERRDVVSIIDSTLGNADPLYLLLRRRLERADWNGLLLLGLDLSQMPSQLGALESLVDDEKNGNRLPVHHVGIDLSAIEDSGQTKWKTAVFGLVDFKRDDDGGFKPADPDKLQLRLKILQLLVENDAVRSFTSEVEVETISFLGTAVETPNKLVLFGRYESRVTEKGERRDTYTFETQFPVPIEFDGDYFLEKVTISRVGLVTIVEGGTKWGKLLIDGSLVFGELGAGLDILGIDLIEFFDLGVTFGLDGGTFKLDVDYPSLRFDFEGFNRRNGKSKPRLPSFLAKLPIKLRGFRFGEFSLPKIGYFEMAGIPGVDLVPDFKMAFDFDVNLGSLGSLGKKLERFKLSLLAGWTPQSSGRPRLAFGFRVDVGEGAGGIDLGIEGIIRLTAERFRLTKAKSADGRELIFLAADSARLKIFSVDLPSASEKLTFYLFAPMGAGAPFAEYLGWYARLVDDAPEPPIAISELALGQRIYLDFDEVKTIRETFGWLHDKQEFKTDKEFAEFAGAPNSILSYAPNREWFAGMAGTFFEIVELQLLLRDPDLYGVYIAILGEDALSVDLLYQKLADGVGRYVAEIMLPAELRNFDFGAVAVTLGAIRVEVYTDGGFLIDLGFPEDVDYSRSFVIQGGPFIGKGGFYIGRVAREAMPSIPNYSTGKAFRVGFALRIGLGREVQKGPMSASLSVSVYGRFEGLIARKHKALAEREVAPALLGDRGYYIWIQGEVGIILEIEGRVDLKLIQAKLLVRAWVGAGVTFESGQPIVLYARMGVKISLEVVIGRIKIFGKKIEIKVRVGYETELRYEWVLPARFPETLLARHAALPAKVWEKLALADLSLAPVAFELRLLLDISRSIDSGTHAVLIPSAFLYDAPDSAGPHPLAALGAALIELAVRGLGEDPAAIHLCRTVDPDHAEDLDVQDLRAALAGLDQLPTSDLEALLARLFPNATIDIAFGGSQSTAPAAEQAGNSPEAFAFPIPPGLQLRIGSKVYDFAQLGPLTDAEVEAIVSDLSRQFAQQSNSRLSAAATGPRPGVDHLFRSWCELFALTALDTIQNAWDRQLNRIKLADLLNGWDWRTAAQRSGRTFSGGLRIADGTGSKALMDRVGLLLPLPGADADISIDGIAAPWLTKGDGALKLLAANAALVAKADPSITCSVVEPPAIHVRHRSFLQPPWLRLRRFAGGAEVALLNRFSEDFRGQLQRLPANVVPPLEHKARQTDTASGEEVVEHPLGAAPPLAMAFDMVCDLVPRGRAEANSVAEALDDCVQVSGSSEAERRPLDALLAGDDTVVEQRLRGATLYLALPSATTPEDYEFIDAATVGVQLARATTSVERRPGFEVAFRAASADDDIFIADGTDLLKFLKLLQRAAIVNSSGTYLLLPPQSELFKRFKADPALRLTVIVKFDPTAALPVHAVNGCCLVDAADRQTLQKQDGGKPRRLATRALPSATAAQLPSLFETVALREPGSVMLRVFRPKYEEVTPSDPPTLEECEAHLALQFDMLEYGVQVGGEATLAIDRSVPIASEEALSAKASPAQQEDVKASLPKDADPDNLLRYDLVVALWRLRGFDNPYQAVDGQRSRISLGWRDLYGNRLGKVVHEQSAICLYQDPLIPVHAWPGVRAWVSVGTQLKTLTAKFAFLPEPGIAESAEQEDWVRRLRAVIHQLEGPGVSVRLVSSLGAVGNVGDIKGKLVKELNALLKPGPVPNLLPIDVPITIDRTRAHSEIDLHLIVERETAKCDPIAPPDVRMSTSSLPLRHQAADADAKSVGDESTLIATEFFAAFKGYRAAIGTNDLGGNSWWAVDERLIPAPTADQPIMYSQPPLARAPMSESKVDFERLETNGSKTPSTADVVDVDSDQLMESLLQKVDAFLAPPLAARTSRVGTGAANAPFIRVMKAKKAMLVSGPDSLLSHVRPVFYKVADKHGAAARRAMREAMATKMDRFHEVASVVVQPLSFAASVPDSWFPIEGEEESAPKLYGRLRFGGTDDKSDTARNLIRALNHGIPLRGRDTELAFTVLPPSDQRAGRLDSIDLTDKAMFEVTHVEREVVLGARVGSLHAPPAPSPSRWLSFVPVNGAIPLPLIDISRKAEVAVPAPLRRLPKPPGVTKPETMPAATTPLPPPYAAAIHAAKQWQFQFELSGVKDITDQACCRLIYNAGVGLDALPKVESAAQPLFPELLRPLVAFDQAMLTAWPEIACAAGPAEPTHFATACDIFADYLEKVVASLSTRTAALNAADIDEDRFLLYWKVPGTAVVAFVDHVPSSNGGAPPGSEKPRKPLAGDATPTVRLGYAGQSVEKTVSQPDFKAEFALGGTVGDPFIVGIKPLNALRLQSIWAAASVRRNAMIDNKPLDPLFVFRTPEIYMQEALVPRLKVEAGIDLGPRPAESLAKRLEAALAPVFVGAKGKIPVQLRVGVESIRLAAATQPASGGGFVAEPDPKLQLVEEVGETDVPGLAERIGRMISAMLAAEPIGRPQDVRLVLSVSALTQGKQPLLDILRILVPLTNVTLLPGEAVPVESETTRARVGRAAGIAALGLLLIPLAVAVGLRGRQKKAVRD